MQNEMGKAIIYRSLKEVRHLLIHASNWLNLNLTSKASDSVIFRKVLNSIQTSLNQKVEVLAMKTFHLHFIPVGKVDRTSKPKYNPTSSESMHR
jgi:hypothetical protein